jgi:subtilase family serine protease
MSGPFLRDEVPREVLVFSYTGYRAPLPGSHKIIVRVDPSGKIDEAIVYNNESSLDFSVGGTPPQTLVYPDLVISSVRLDPPETTILGNFKVVVIIKNQSQVAATVPAGKYILQAEALGVKHVEEVTTSQFVLQPNETKEFLCTPIRLDVGTSTWTVKVDPQNNIRESNEDNNTASIAVTIKES